jgi:hypothetical protein
MEIEKKINFEVSVSEIKSYVASKGTSEITLDEVDNDLVLAVDDNYRDDIITKEYIESLKASIYKTHLNTYLRYKDINIDHLTFGNFWDNQVDIYHRKHCIKKEKQLPTYIFTEKYINTLYNFFKKTDKKEKFNEFITNIPNGQIRQELNIFFGILHRIILGEENIVDINIKGSRKGKDIKLIFELNKSEQNKWKQDMLNYLACFIDIDDLNKENFYKKELLKPHTFINTLYYIFCPGVGNGEMLICYLINGAKAQGGGVSYDVILLNGKTYEVKDYLESKGSIRLGTEGKLTQFDFWKDIVKSIDVATSIFKENEKELRNILTKEHFKFWTQVINTEKRGESFSKAVAAGIAAGELSNRNLEILKIWYYLTHELFWQKFNVYKHYQDQYYKLVNLKYIINPLQLDEDLENSSTHYFNQNPDLNAFVVFRPDKVNIIEKGDLRFSTISQASVKFLESELANRNEKCAKIAFKNWKNDPNKESLSYYEDFYLKLQKEIHMKKRIITAQKEYDKKIIDWNKRFNAMEKRILKLKSIEAQKRNKVKWLTNNPEPTY